MSKSNGFGPARYESRTARTSTSTSALVEAELLRDRVRDRALVALAAVRVADLPRGLCGVPPNQGGKAGLSVPIVSWSAVTRLRSPLFEQLLAADDVEPEELFCRAAARGRERERAEQQRADAMTMASPVTAVEANTAPRRANAARFPHPGLTDPSRSPLKRADEGRPASGLAALLFAALASSAAARPAPPPKPKTITAPGRIEALALDGYPLAYDVAARRHEDSAATRSTSGTSPTRPRGSAAGRPVAPTTPARAQASASSPWGVRAA